MVVVFDANISRKRASFAIHLRPENKFADSLADRAGFEPAAALR
jgi:hypothetical protein